MLSAEPVTICPHNGHCACNPLNALTLKTSKLPNEKGERNHVLQLLFVQQSSKIFSAIVFQIPFFIMYIKEK
ncbi:hypothetical protein AN964_11560 [Heyndrickxia shackletonii]|uniref:Uncharacterized protein n=1 Tax=Heyndrickxia shackletonii TaxID=157838 RepID=A0A0Q3WXN3_9BACI|nr:hypothetical protein [Heyndrickxia shackletonii]KQL54071.1 hypothetical protein AN964_11560 [Heyndrickxia shackletonii]NEY99381.1 hypothetical protein [Heyndrickxia shackletonii]